MKFEKVIEPNIDGYLIFMERILLKYQELPEGALYVRGKRYPIEDRRNIEKYIKLRILGAEQKKPYLMKDGYTICVKK